MKSKVFYIARDSAKGLGKGYTIDTQKMKIHSSILGKGYYCGEVTFCETIFRKVTKLKIKPGQQIKVQIAEIK